MSGLSEQLKNGSHNFKFCDPKTRTWIELDGKLKTFIEEHECCNETSRSKHAKSLLNSSHQTRLKHFEYLETIAESRLIQEFGSFLNHSSQTKGVILYCFALPAASIADVALSKRFV